MILPDLGSEAVSVVQAGARLRIQRCVIPAGKVEEEGSSVWTRGRRES